MSNEMNTGNSSSTMPTVTGQAEGQRAIAEVQAAFMVARAAPRDAIKALESILVDCQRPGLAEAALYTYAKGGGDVTGPSIRLAEAMARRWGNIECGVKELSRKDGVSECVAYAVDLETNFRDSKTFQVKHWRDTKKGGYALKDERDIYELVANMGARRKRACLLSVIPGDIVEEAVAQCEATMETNVKVTPESIQKMMDTFASFGVTKEHIETRIQRKLDAIQPAQIVGLKKIYASLRDGMSTPGDWFAVGVEESASATESLKDKLRKKVQPEAVAPDMIGTFRTYMQACTNMAEWAEVASMGQQLPPEDQAEGRKIAAEHKKRLQVQEAREAVAK